LLFERARPGILTWIGVRPAHGAPMLARERAVLLSDRGVEGDVTAMRTGGRRQVSLIQAEHLTVIEQLGPCGQVTPELLRRNLVVRGINLLTLRSTRFRIGQTLLEGTGTCDPCSQMERALGIGGYNAMRGHGGILARVIEGGPIALNDEVDFVR
jgi:MOSC domain-containing protein YiiM